MLSLGRLKQIIDRINEGVLTLDVEGRIDHASERAASMLSRRPEEIIGRLPAELGLPDLRDEEEREAHFHRKDGSDIWLSLTATPLLDQGQKSGTLVLMRNIGDRRRAERSLDEAEVRYRSLFQNPHEVVALLRYVLDGEGMIADAVFVDVNELFSKTIRLPREDIIGRKASEILGTKDFQQNLPMLQAMKSGDRPVNFDTYFGLLDAHVRNFLVPVDGETFILSSMDKTRATHAKHQAEESAETARQQSEALDALMDAVPSAIWIAHDPECRVITGNRAADTMYESGVKENVSAGTSAGEELNPARRFFRDGRELRPEELPMQVAAAKGIEVRNFEVEVLVPSGKRITMLGHAIPLFDGEGKVRGSVASFIDITERKRYEQELAFQARLLASSHDAIVAMSRDGTLTYWNTAAEEMFGWTAEEAIGWNATELLWINLPDPKREEATRRLLEAGHFDGESIFHRKDGKEIYTSSHARVLKDCDGAIVEIVCSFRDISESKRAERELKEYSRKLERYNSELQQFAYITSHDLQEPLRMITLYMDLLERRHGDELSPQAREYMEIARQGARRMRQLINDLLLYSRIETNRSEFTDVDMTKVFEATVKELALAVSEARAMIEIDPMPVVYANEAQMRQLATNLIGNAVKFRRAGTAPAIEVTASTIGDVCVFSVRDNGIGIDPKYQDKLFKMFYRLHTRDEYPGSGIGLAICKKIVERHGGWIWIDSDGKSGCTFHFTIPHGRTPDQAEDESPIS